MSKYLVLIEPGGIGDYIFCRPFFKFIRQSNRFKDHKIIYIAQDRYSDFVHKYDKKYFDHIITYNIDALSKNKHYQKYFYQEINKFDIDTLWNLRTNIIPNQKDTGYRRRLALKIKAKHKIVEIIKTQNNFFLESKIKFYNEPYYCDLDMSFELERRQKIFSKILNIDIPEQNLIDTYKNPDVLSNYIVLSTQALNQNRMLPLEKWNIIITNLQTKYPNKKLVFIGSDKDSNYIQELIYSLPNKSNCINFAGKTSLAELPEFLKRCDFMIAVETGTVHIANLVGCKTICLSNGAFYNRFHPYKNSSVSYIYPEKFNELIKTDSLDKLDVWSGNSPCNTMDISIENII